MKVFTVTARWVETYKFYIKADDAESAEEIVSSMIADQAIGDAYRVDKDWTIDTPHQTDEAINPQDIIEVEY